MKSGKCPKCGSEEIYRHENTGNAEAIVISMTAVAYPVIYVCADCGMVEQYIENDEHLNEIKSKWTPVNKMKKRKNDDVE